MDGILVKWVPSGGYGFISTDESKYDIFVHAKQLLVSGIGDVRVGDLFEFEIEESTYHEKARAASLVRLAEGYGVVYETQIGAFL
ncbi:MAG: cold shock domain-containing protein [Rhodospirillaceae bacterium]